jgi:hypothetical protein
MPKQDARAKMLQRRIGRADQQSDGGVPICSEERANNSCSGEERRVLAPPCHLA